MLHYVPIPFRWRPVHMNGRGLPDLPLSRKIERRMERAFIKWEGTPYMSGQQVAGEGTDCLRYWAAIVDEMYGYRREAPERLPPDYLLHKRSGTITAFRKLFRLYPEIRGNRVRGPFLEPGDSLVVGPEGGGAGHCLLVGTEHNTLWHAVQGSGVCKTGWALQEGYQKLIAVFRFRDREKWGEGVR